MPKIWSPSRAEHADIIKHVWQSEDFKQKLLADPRSALTELSVNVPEGVEISIHFDNDETLHVISPAHDRDGAPRIVHLRSTDDKSHIVIPSSNWKDEDRASQETSIEARSIFRFIRGFARGYGEQVRAVRRAIKAN